MPHVADLLLLTEVLWLIVRASTTVQGPTAPPCDVTAPPEFDPLAPRKERRAALARAADAAAAAAAAASRAEREAKAPAGTLPGKKEGSNGARGSAKQDEQPAGAAEQEGRL